MSRRHRAARVLSGAVSMLLVMLWTSGALADEILARLSFDLPYAERPSALCFISNVQSNGVTVSDFKKLVEAPATPIAGQWWVTPLAACDSSEGAEATKRCKDERKVVEPLEPFITDLARPGPSECASDACRAAIALTAPRFDKFRISCVKSSDQAEKHVAVVMFDFHQQEPPTLLGGYLAGTTASISVKGTKAETFVSVRSLGGDYLPGADVTMARDASRHDAATIPLVPRCRPHDVQLPVKSVDAISSVDLHLEVGRQTIFRCQNQPVGSDGRLMSVMLPSSDDESSSNLVLTANPGTLRLSQFLGTWRTLGVGQTLVARRMTVSFEWERELLLGERCPDASLAGMHCHEEVSTPTYCHYVCGERRDTPAATFDLPASVRFTSHDLVIESWDDTLMTASQHLRSYVAPENRTLVLDFTQWQGSGGANQITSFVLDIPGGNSLYMTPVGTQVARVPALRSGQVLTYHYRGARAFNEDGLPILTRERIAPDPNETVRDILFSGFLGAGVGIPAGKSGFGPDVDSISNWWYPAIGASIAYRKWRSPWSFELHGTYVFTSRAYFPMSPSGGKRNDELVAYHRFGPSAAVGWRPIAPLVFGVRAGMLFSMPFFREDHERLVGGTSVNPIIFAFGRVRLADLWWLELEPGVVLAEQYTEFTRTSRGDSTLRAGTAPSVVLGAGVRFGRQ